MTELTPGAIPSSQHSMRLIGLMSSATNNCCPRDSYILAIADGRQQCCTSYSSLLIASMSEPKAGFPAVTDVKARVL